MQAVFHPMVSRRGRALLCPMLSGIYGRIGAFAVSFMPAPGAAHFFSRTTVLPILYQFCLQYNTAFRVRQDSGKSRHMNLVGMNKSSDELVNKHTFLLSPSSHFGYNTIKFVVNLTRRLLYELHEKNNRYRVARNPVGVLFLLRKRLGGERG